jgi:uncharacterized protein (DUF608 family)
MVTWLLYGYVFGAIGTYLLARHSVLYYYSEFQDSRFPITDYALRFNYLKKLVTNFKEKTPVKNPNRLMSDEEVIKVLYVSCVIWYEFLNFLFSGGKYCHTISV